jgi:hypothetical protein
MFDAKQWISRLRHFVEKCRELKGDVRIEIDIDEPASESDIHKIAQLLPHGIPADLQHFYMNGARSITCRYIIDNYDNRLGEVYQSSTPGSYVGGGLNRWSLDSLIATQRHFNDWLEGLDERGDPDALIWHKCMPFVTIPNGDMLALEITTDGSPNKVVYLDHDGSPSRIAQLLIAELLKIDYDIQSDTKVIAESFDKFMEIWEEVCYIGPEKWEMHPFIDVQTGMLTPDVPEADKLRQCFQNGST